jgi:oligopeptidase B
VHFLTQLHTLCLFTGGQGDFDSPVLRLSYTSLTTPASIIDYSMASCQRALKKVQPVLGGFKSSDYLTSRLWAESHDGEMVPISLVYR